MRPGIGPEEGEGEEHPDCHSEGRQDYSDKSNSSVFWRNLIASDV